MTNRSKQHEKKNSLPARTSTACSAVVSNHMFQVLIPEAPQQKNVLWQCQTSSQFWTCGDFYCFFWGGGGCGQGARLFPAKLKGKNGFGDTKFYIVKKKITINSRSCFYKVLISWWTLKNKTKQQQNIHLLLCKNLRG